MVSGGDLQFDGSAKSVKSISFDVDGNVVIGGTLETGESIDILAGQGTAHSGNINTEGAHLTTTADSPSIPGSGISLTAGANAGDILFTALETGTNAYLTSLSAQDAIRLSALSGSVTSQIFVGIQALLKRR